MKEKWTCEQANEWYSKLGWLRGCNFIGSDCANRLDMFQAHRCEEKLATAEREIALCEKIGFNTVRIWANFDVYYKEPDSYMEIFDRYIDIFARHGQKVMVVLCHEEDLPLGDEFRAKEMGEQTYALGWHQGRTPLTDEEKALKPHHYLEYDETGPLFLEMVKRTVEKYARDERILAWNIYNEPGISLDGELAMSIMTELFDLVRSLDPIQPLCSDIWHTTKDGEPATPEEKLSLELSDIISYHCYGDYVKQVLEIHALQKYNRPIFQTEWLHRINHNTVQEVDPLFYITNVANYCWGFVVGKTQTNEPWDVMWEWLDNGDPRTAKYDFTKWQHDLFRPNLRPYDPNEIALIKRFNDKAKKEGR